MKTLFLLRSLDRGGAERQLVELARGLRAAGHGVEVAVFYGGGALEPELRDAGVPVHDLAKRGRWDVAGFLRRLVGLACEIRPQIVHSYLVVPNLILSLVKPWLGGAKVVWGVRASDMDQSRYDWFSGATFFLADFAAGRADLIISNSEAGKEFHQRRGYPADRIIVIPNGIDANRFRPDREGAARLRGEWGIAEGDRLVGNVARLDPMKDHRTFLDAAARVTARLPGVRFVCVGSGPALFARELREFATGLGLGERVIWAGPRDDLPCVYGALDLMVSSSAFGEGFSNAIAEAMSCGVPCVATDVGDAAFILAGRGTIVPPRDSDGLGEAMVRALGREDCDPAAIRRSIVERFSVERMISSTETALRGLLGREG